MDLIQVLADMEWCEHTGSMGQIQDMVSLVITVIQIAIPLLLIVYGMLDLGKAVVASKEDDIKKGQQMFIKRLISAALVFLIIFIVKILISVVAPKKASNDNDLQTSETIIDCVNHFINGK